MLQYLIDRVQGKAPKGARRSPKWRKVRAEFLRENPQCESCGGVKKLVVHHILPFYIAPNLELDKDNLITLCEAKRYGVNCHLLFGHHGNFQKFNPIIRATSIQWREILRHER